MTTSKKEEQQQRRKKKQQELDSILDAALDELEDDSSSDSTEEENEAVPTAALNPNYSNFDYNGGDSSQTNNAAAATAAAVDNGNTMGVPYSLEYLANNPHGHNETNNRRNNNHHRPKFGPEPPPQPSPALQPSSSLDQHGLSAEEANLAASLEGMMKQFASGLDAAGVDFNNEKDMADLEHAEKALEEMFKQMMMGDAAAGSGMAMPSTPPPSSNAAATGGDGAVNGQSKKSSTTGKNSTKKSSSNNKNQKESNEKTESNNNDVDESINRLLDGINQASSSQQTTMPTTTIPPNNNNNIDPSSSQLEHLSEQMISSLMNDFEQSTSKKDSNDIIENVMKQLLDKELMYQPMKEVCTRYPKWLANNKDSLPPDEYQKYGTQYQYFQRIVRLYETETNNFERLMELMQDIQEYGQPPVEIIRELAPELKFDEEGMPVMDVMGDGSGGMMPGMPFPMMGGGTGAEQCCIS